MTTNDNDGDTGDTRFTLSPAADGNPAVVRVDLCGENPHQSKQWRAVIQQLINGETLSVSSSHDFMDTVHTLPGRIKKYAGHRFGSFCPPRLQERAHWYVDGVEYFPKVFKAIENAKSQIMIADWMLNPEVRLCACAPCACSDARVWMHAYVDRLVSGGPATNTPQQQY